MSFRLIGAVGFGILLGMSFGTGGSHHSTTTGLSDLVGLGVPTAQARGRGRVRGSVHRRTRRGARRVVRRTTRRVVRRTAITGCSPWNNYWNCGGVYYVRSGDVYIVVNP